MHGLVDLKVGPWVAISCGGLLTLVAVPVDALEVVVGVDGLGGGEDIFCIFHVDIGVVSHHADGVFPCSAVGVEHVADEFVNNDLCFCCRGDGQAAHSAVGAFLEGRYALAVSEEGEVVFCYV